MAGPGYARARAEGLGYECAVGIMERPERLALLTLGLFLGYRVLVIVLTVLAVTTTYTFIQRILHVHRVAGADNRPLESLAAPEPEPDPESTESTDTPTE